MRVKESEILPEPNGPWDGADLCFLSPQPEPAYTARPQIYHRLVYRAVCSFTPRLLLVLTASIHGGMARLSWPEWLVTYQDGLPVRRWSPMGLTYSNFIDWDQCITTRPNRLRRGIDISFNDTRLLLFRSWFWVSWFPKGELWAMATAVFMPFLSPSQHLQSSEVIDNWCLIFSRPIYFTASLIIFLVQSDSQIC